MRNLDAHFSYQDASLVLQCFYGLHVCGQYIACYYTEHILVGVPAVHLCCNVKLNVWDRRTGWSLRSPNCVSIFPSFPPFFTMIASLSLLVYVSTLNSTNLPIFNPHLCLVVEIWRLVLRLAPFRNFFALSLLQNDFQLDRLAKVTW